jgi:hypothetical protein
MKIRVVILAVMAATWAGSPAAAVAQSPAPSVVPTISCLRFDLETKKLHIFFGYTSTHTGPVTIPMSSTSGPFNFFFPEPEDRFQPTVFLPGAHDMVFYTSFVVDPSGMQALSWLLGDSAVTARHLDLRNPVTSAPCPHPFPLTEGPIGPAGPAGPTGPAGPAGAGLGQATLRNVTITRDRTESATATCAAGETVMGGGGSCTGQRLKTSMPTSDGWTVACQGRTTATATAICARP